MNKRKKAMVLFLPLVILICFFALKFWAQVIPEYDITFTESFDNTDFKDEEKSSVNHWGDGYITLNLAGIFQQIPRAINLPTWINVVTYGDFDFDGLLDIIGTSNMSCQRIAFIKNLGEGVFEEISPPYILDDLCFGQYNALIAGDFDNDGDQDFMYILAREPEEVWFFEHQGWVDANGVPQFTIRDHSSQLSLGLADWETTHQTIDFNQDGDLDILFANENGNVILIQNDGTKPLSDTTKFATSTLIDAKVGEPGNRWDEYGVSSIGIGDFDGENGFDIVIGSVSWRGIKYYKNDGTGNFTLHEVLGDMSGSPDLHDDYYDGACTAIAVSDYDMDGDLDFITGTDNWTHQEIYPPGIEEQGSIELHPCGDFYATGTEMGGKCFYFKNDGSGEFTSSLMYDGPQLIAEGECAAWDFDGGLAMDYDGDGDMDCMLFDGNHSEFYYLFENILYNIFNTDGTAVSTNITAQSFPPDGLDQEAYAITKVQFTALDQSVQGSNSGLKVTYYVSNNGGRDWELYAEFEEGDIHNYADLPVHTFSTFGSDMRWKAEMSAPDDYPPESEFSGTSMDTPRIERIEIKATYVEKQEYSRTSVVVTNVVDENDQRKRYLLASTFYFPSWEGHLRAYDISAMTPESTSYSVLRTVSRPDLSESSGREIVPSGVEIVWDAGELLDARSASSRTVYTATPVDSVLTRVDFTASNVDALGPILQDVNNDNEGLINFIRGEGREWKLGDSNHSNPVVVGPPDETPTLMGDGYLDFMNAWENRRKVLYLGANDGMVHCFDVLTGDELWGFIPYNLLPKLKNMWAVNPDTGDRYFFRDIYVDGSPVVADVYIDADGDASKEWITILICGQGSGKGSTIGGGTNYYFALDITDPDNPQWLWEFTHDWLGESWSVPVVGKVQKNGGDTWVAFVGSGYDNNPDEDVGNTFYAVDLETGEYFWAFYAGGVDTTGESGWGDTPNIPNTIPGSPSIIDINQDGYADRVYVVDLDGRIWKVDISIDYQDLNSWTGEIIYEDSNNYPIISKPAVWINYVSGGSIPRIYFGTGGDDRAPDDATYSFIALKDAPVPEVEWYLGDPTILELPAEKDMGDLSSGERVWADPKVADYIVYFSTLKGNIESVDPCENILGIGKLYARFVQTIAGSIIGGTAFATASGSQESIDLSIKTRAAVTIGERERASDGTRKREVYIQEYDSTIQKLEQSIGAILKIKSWREVFRIIR